MWTCLSDALYTLYLCCMRKTARKTFTRACVHNNSQQPESWKIMTSKCTYSTRVHTHTNTYWKRSKRFELRMELTLRAFIWTELSRRRLPRIGPRSNSIDLCGIPRMCTCMGICMGMGLGMRTCVRVCARVCLRVGVSVCTSVWKCVHSWRWILMHLRWILMHLRCVDSWRCMSSYNAVCLCVHASFCVCVCLCVCQREGERARKCICVGARARMCTRIC